jgi:glycosyltransferase involved in cell wall biosynthesis
MNVLITAPSLDELENVNGISSIVRSIINNNETQHKFFHFKIGKRDNSNKDLKWAFHQISLLPRLALFIKKNKIDAIHLNIFFAKTALLRTLAIFCFLTLFIRKPVLLHIHGGYLLMNPPQNRLPYCFIIKYLLQNSNINIVLSQIEQEQLLKTYQANSYVLPNAVEPLIKTPGNKNFKGKLKLIFLGRIVESKGIYLIVEALFQLKEYHHLFSFTIYGTGQGLENFLHQLKALESLEFEYKGIAKGIEKWQAWEAADIFLLPSIYGEGLPIAMLEAMQAGCIPVVSDDASITTVVENAVNGFVIKKGNVHELIRVLENVITKRDGLSNLSNAAKTTIGEKHNISQYMKGLELCYTAI